ncbi:hypothetical protein A2U01_0111613, partial [Trifolium medium]|nr:hypothetical protein [Trifolium medium]
MSSCTLYLKVLQSSMSSSMIVTPSIPIKT